MSEQRLVIDARMHAHSGIGTYLRQSVPAVAERLPGVRFELLHCPGAPLPTELARLGTAVPWNVAPLSAHELFARPPVDAGSLWWSPHFNVPLRWRGRLLVTLHDLLPVIRPDLGGGRLRRRIVLAWLRRAVARNAVFLCVSAFTQSELRQLAFARDVRATVVPLGVAEAWRDPPRAESSPPYFVYVGLPKRHKNLATLLAAYARLTSTLPHDLVLITDWSGLRSYDRDAIAMAQRMSPRVRIRSDLPVADLMSTVASATALVHPSVYEGFGLTPLEAMAAGTPVIAGRAGSVPEICGDAALLFDPLDVDGLAAAMLRVANDVELRSGLAARGRLRAASYTWSACATSTSAELRAAMTDTA